MLYLAYCLFSHRQRFAMFMNATSLVEINDACVLNRDP